MLVAASLERPGVAAHVGALPGLEFLPLDFAGAALVRGLPNDHYATLAEGSFSVPEGDYTIELTTDDGAKLNLDDKPLVADAWKYQGPTLYSHNVHLTAGKHTLHLEHFQIDGYAALKVNIRPQHK